MAELPADDVRAWLSAHFPQDLAKAERFYDADEALRQICEDLAEASRALRYWRAQSEPAPERALEYRNLVEELGAELKAYLDTIA
ncbi:MAG: hypothetical protein AB7K86_10400 [Rhodospirillales bacterium]